MTLNLEWEKTCLRTLLFLESPCESITKDCQKIVKDTSLRRWYCNVVHGLSRPKSRPSTFLLLYVEDPSYFILYLLYRLQMQAELTKYTDYYKSKHSGRVLDWDHSLGTVTLKARFNPGDKELTVSLYQALVLVLFNENTEIPYVDIKEQTNMGETLIQ